MTPNPYFVGGDFFQERLRGLVVVPETFDGALLFQLSYFFTASGDVKVTSRCLPDGTSGSAVYLLFLS